MLNFSLLSYALVVKINVLAVQLCSEHSAGIEIKTRVPGLFFQEKCVQVCSEHVSSCGQVCCQYKYSLSSTGLDNPTRIKTISHSNITQRKVANSSTSWSNDLHGWNKDIFFADATPCSKHCFRGGGRIRIC